MLKWRLSIKESKMEIQAKKCSGCSKELALESFNKSKSGRLGLHNHCRACQKICKRRNYLLNIEKEKQYSKEYNKSDKAKEYRKKRYLEDREKLLEINRVLRRTPSARIKADLSRKKLTNNKPSFKIARNFTGKLRLFVKGKCDTDYMRSMVGCSRNELIAYITSKFTNGMSWDNYGYYGWHLDHIKPYSSFDLTKEEERRECFHYTNIQPLWQKDNISKGNSYEGVRYKSS